MWISCSFFLIILLKLRMRIILTILTICSYCQIQAISPLCVMQWAPSIQIFLMFIYFSERERERKWVREGKGNRGRPRFQSRLQAPRCQHRVRRGAQTHELWDHDLNRSLVKIRGLTNGATQAPHRYSNMLLMGRLGGSMGWASDFGLSHDFMVCDHLCSLSLSKIKQTFKKCMLLIKILAGVPCITKSIWTEKLVTWFLVPGLSVMSCVTLDQECKPTGERLLPSSFKIRWFNMLS